MRCSDQRTRKNAELAGRTPGRALRRGGENYGDRGTEPPRNLNSLEKLAAVVSASWPKVKAATAQNVLEPGCAATMPAATAEMLAKHGIGDGPVDVRALDAALVSAFRAWSSASQ